VEQAGEADIFGLAPAPEQIGYTFDVVGERAGACSIPNSMLTQSPSLDGTAGHGVRQVDTSHST
jgi:hypothetical protein